MIHDYWWHEQQELETVISTYNDAVASGAIKPFLIDDILPVDIKTNEMLSISIVEGRILGIARSTHIDLSSISNLGRVLATLCSNKLVNTFGITPLT